MFAQRHIVAISEFVNTNRHRNLTLVSRFTNYIGLHGVIVTLQETL